MLQYETRRFRSTLNAEGLQNLRHAKLCFLVSQYLPMVLYYLGTSEEQLKFPASLSYTTSRGLPRWTCLTFWLMGWSFFLRLLSTTNLPIMAFATQMMATAWICAVYNRPHQSLREDLIHLVAATLYILDHVFLMELLNVGSIYQLCFHIFFALTALSQCWGVYVKRRAGIECKHSSSALEWRTTLARLQPQAQKELWWAEMSFMISENLIFTSFVLGLTSGLQLAG